MIICTCNICSGNLDKKQFLLLANPMRVKTNFSNRMYFGNRALFDCFWERKKTSVVLSFIQAANVEQEKTVFPGSTSLPNASSSMTCYRISAFFTETSHILREYFSSASTHFIGWLWVSPTANFTLLRGLTASANRSLCPRLWHLRVWCQGSLWKIEC